MRNYSIAQIINALTEAYGERHNHPSGTPMEVLVETILSQNTSDANSGRAFASLRAAFPTWEAVLEADPRAIADSIRVGGLDAIKSARIKRVLGDIKEQRGGLELDFLGGLPVPEARDWLTRLPGVGLKTASCVLLFALGRPALPVDTHIFRVAKRLVLIEAKASVEKAHFLLEGMVPPEMVYQFHVLMIEHGRRTCKAQRPRCRECVLAEICPSYEIFAGPK